MLKILIRVIIEEAVTVIYNKVSDIMNPTPNLVKGDLVVRHYRHYPFIRPSNFLQLGIIMNEMDDNVVEVYLFQAKTNERVTKKELDIVNGHSEK